MPRSFNPAARDGMDPVRQPRGRRLAWAPAVVLTTLVVASSALAQPKLIVSPDKKGVEKVKVGELRLRPNIRMEWFLHVRNDQTGPAGMYTVKMFVGDNQEPLAATAVKVAKGKTSLVVFGKPPAPKAGKAAPPKEGKAAPLPLAEIKGPLTIRLFDPKGNEIAGAMLAVKVAAPKEYVTVDSVTFDPNEKTLQVKLSTIDAAFVGPPARASLVLPPNRIPDLIPGKKKGTYGGLLAPKMPLTLQAEGLKFRESAELKQGLFYVVIDDYPRAFSFVSSFTGEMGTQQPRAITGPVLRLVHPAFVKPGAKLPVVVEVDNMATEDVCTLAMYRDKALTPAGREGQVETFTGNRAEVVLLNPKGPEGALVFATKVGDHAVAYDTKEIYGARYLAAGIKAKDSKDKTGHYISVTDSKLIPEFGQTAKAETERVIEPVRMYEGGSEVTLDLDLPPSAPGKNPQLVVGAPLPVKATVIDPTGVAKAVFFLGKMPRDGKIPPGTAQAEGEPALAAPNVWVAQLPAPTQKGGLVTVSVQVENGLGEKTVRTIRVQLIDPKAVPPGGPVAPKLATITGIVHEGSRPTPGVPVTLSDAKGALKAATKTNAAGVYKFEQVPPGAYVVNATRSASMTRGRALVSVPAGVVVVENVNVKLTR